MLVFKVGEIAQPQMWAVAVDEGVVDGDRIGVLE